MALFIYKSLVLSFLEFKKKSVSIILNSSDNDPKRLNLYLYLQTYEIYTNYIFEHFAY